MAVKATNRKAATANPPPPSSSSSLNPLSRYRHRRAEEKRRERAERRAEAEEARREELSDGNFELRHALSMAFFAPETPEERAKWPTGLPEATRVLLRFVDVLDEVVPESPRPGRGGDGEGEEVKVWMRAGEGKGKGKDAEEKTKGEEVLAEAMGRLRGGGDWSALSSTTGSSVSEYSQQDDGPPYDPGNNDDDNNNNASSAAAESSSAPQLRRRRQQQQQQQRPSHTPPPPSPFPRPPNPTPSQSPQPPSQTTTTMKPPHSTIFPSTISPSIIFPLGRIFPLPVPERLKELLPPSFRRLLTEEKESGTGPTSPTSPTQPLWSECFGAMKPRAVAVRGKEYEERKGLRFRGPYWVEDGEGRVKAVEDEEERRGLLRRWFGDEEGEEDEDEDERRELLRRWFGDDDEDDKDEDERRGLVRRWFGDDDEDDKDDKDEDEEVSDDGEPGEGDHQAKRPDRGKSRGSGDGDGDNDDEQPVMGKLRGGGMGHVYEPAARTKYKVYRDDHYDWRIFRTPPLPHPVDEFDDLPRWLRPRRKHSTIVPIPDWMWHDTENDPDTYMTERLGVSSRFGPPRLEIEGPSESWEVVFPSWTPQELAGLQRGWEECRYGRYAGPYWKSDEKGKVRVVETREERDRLMEEWFIEGKGKWRGSLSSKQRAKLNTHPETRQTGDILTLRGGGLRGGGHFDDADDEYSGEAEARGLFDDSDSGSSTYSDSDSDSESSTDHDEDHDGSSGFHYSGNVTRNTRVYIDEDPSNGPCRIYTIDRLDSPTPRNNNNDEHDPAPYYYHYHLHGTFARGTTARIERDQLTGRHSLYIEEPHNDDNTSTARIDGRYNPAYTEEPKNDSDDNTAIARTFRRSLRTLHPARRLPSVRALWRDYYWTWPVAWQADGGFNWELWGLLLRQLNRVRRERARLGRRRERRGRRRGGASGDGRDDDEDDESDHDRRSESGSGGGGASGGDRHGRQPDDDVDVESNHHRRSENGSDGGNATLSSSDLYKSDSSEEGDDGEEKSPGLSGTTAAASGDSGSERKLSEGSGEEHGKRGNGSGSGSDWEAYWGNLAGKRIPTDEDDDTESSCDTEEPRASEQRGRGGRLDRKAERVEAERRRREKDALARRERAAERPDDDDEEKGYDSAASGECREVIRQLCTEGQPPHEIRLQMYLHYLNNDAWRGEEGRESFWNRMLEILDEEIGLAEAGEQQTISTGGENTVNAWQKNLNSDEVGRLRGGSGSNADGRGTSDGDDEPPVSDTRPDEAGEQGGVHGGDGVDQEPSDALNFWMFWFVFGDTGR
ncbi:hypothetical protein SLS54_008189 [Diplodia seriata]